MEMTTKQRFKLNLATSTDSDNDWEKTWVVLPAGITDEEIGERWAYNPEGDYCQHSYDCCANWYADPIRIKRVNQRVLVTQNHYRNV